MDHRQHTPVDDPPAVTKRARLVVTERVRVHGADRVSVVLTAGTGFEVLAVAGGVEAVKLAHWDCHDATPNNSN